MSFLSELFSRGTGERPKLMKEEALSVQLGFVAFSPFSLAFVFYSRPGGGRGKICLSFLVERSVRKFQNLSC